jgi:hypothetical protein
MDPIAKMALEFGEALAKAIPVLFELFKRAGGRDGFLVALDASLAVAREKNDADLDAALGR